MGDRKGERGRRRGNIWAKRTRERRTERGWEIERVREVREGNINTFTQSMSQIGAGGIREGRGVMGWVGVLRQ